ncbi:LysR family transcriptional regulator [Thalassotalea euphylliae]|uniref:LysR family transcriptional regulator n=1 Tax=Thalassotalea euphylliae TaxID=1655234 RepID=UPI003624E934
MKYHITYKQLEAFVVVAKAGSFAKACEQLHISQPALSISIKNLEEQIGGKLFHRTTRAIELSPEGRQFLADAERILLDSENAFDEVRNRFLLNKGVLHVAVMPSFASANLSSYLTEFKHQYPTLNIKISDVVAEEAIEMVRAERAELAITFDPGEHDDLVFTPLFTDHFIAAVPHDHVLTNQAEVSWQALAQQPFIALQKPSSIRHVVEQSLKVHDVALNVEIEANQLLTIAKLVASGLGVSVLPKLFAHELQQENVVLCEVVEPAISRNIGIVTKNRKGLSQAAQRFMTLMRAQFQQD